MSGVTSEIRSASVPLRPLKPPTIVSIGDSLTAGVMDAVTDVTRQPFCYSKQLANQLGIPYNTPDIGPNAIPPAIWWNGAFDTNRYLAEMAALKAAVTPVAVYLATVGIPDDQRLQAIYQADGMGQRLPSSVDTPSHPQHNFAVSGFALRHMCDTHSVRDYLQEIRDGLDGTSSLAAEIPDIHAQLQNGTAQIRGSEVEQAVGKSPDMVIAWAGNNDALASVFGGVVDDRTLTPLLDQPWTYWNQNPTNGEWYQTTTDKPVKGFYSALLEPGNLIDSLLKQTRGPIMLMNIPDVTVVPYLKVLGQKVGPLPFRILLKDGTDVTTQMENFVIPTGVKGAGKNGRTTFPPGSRIGLLALLSAVVAPTKAEFETKLNQNLFTEFDVLDPDELNQIQARLGQFNELIKRAASLSPRIRLVDMNGILRDLRDNGRELRGEGPPVMATATFTGTRDSRGYEGIFGYDGIHPTQVGHAVIANVVLQHIKTELASDPVWGVYKDAPFIDEKAVLARDPHHQKGESAMVLDAATLDAMRARFAI